MAKSTITKVTMLRERVTALASDASRELNNQGCYGTLLENGRLQLSLPETMYLLDKGRIALYSGKKKLDADDFLAKAQKIEPTFWTRYKVFKDLRDRGYIVKTALKFGADFRVYERGIKPGEDHAKWIVYPQHESSTMTWHEFSAKNRVAHSTRKRLLIGVVDDEGDVTYYEVRWVRP